MQSASFIDPAWLTDHVKFHSKGVAPYNTLSNFHRVGAGVTLTYTQAQATPALLRACPRLLEFMGGQDAKYPSSEHAWQSLKADDRASFARFQTGGDLTDWSPNGFMPFVSFDAAKAMKKFKHWAEKNNIGVLAKFASNPKYAVNLDIALGYTRERLSADDERAVWRVILDAKFSQNADCRRVLLDTGTRYLLEFVSGANRDFAKGIVTHWGGLINNGRLVGENVMGNYLMEARARLAVKA